MPRFGRYGPCLKAFHPRKSLRGLLRKRRQAGSIPAVKHGLKNAGETKCLALSGSTEQRCAEYRDVVLERLGSMRLGGYWPRVANCCLGLPDLARRRIVRFQVRIVQSQSRAEL
jgi:hypothetical protein